MSSDIKYCRECGTEVQATDEHCTECGSALQADAGSDKQGADGSATDTVGETSQQQRPPTTDDEQGVVEKLKPTSSKTQLLG